jgi:hypothetical protein
MPKVTATPNSNSRPNRIRTPHTHDIKPESDYQKGAQNEVGHDIRRSRQNAIDFQKHKAKEE